MFADNKLSVKCLLSLFIAWLGLRYAVAARQRGQASTPEVSRNECVFYGVTLPGSYIQSP